MNGALVFPDVPARETLPEDLWIRAAKSGEPGRNQGAFVVALRHRLLGSDGSKDSELWKHRYSAAREFARVPPIYYSTLMSGDQVEWAHMLASWDDDRKLATMFLSDLPKKEREEEWGVLNLPSSLDVLGAEISPFRGKNYVVRHPRQSRLPTNWCDSNGLAELFLREKEKDFNSEAVYMVVFPGWNLDKGIIINLSDKTSMIPWY